MLGPDVLDASKFPQIWFNSTEVRPLEPDRWLIHGNLDLHGRVRPVVVKVVRENGRYRGSTTLLQSDFGISPISIVGGTVKVKDEVTIEFDIVTAAR
jgi:polyisoprenoid-binding protein YceI